MEEQISDMNIMHIKGKVFLLLVFLTTIGGIQSAWAATVYYKIINNSGNVVVVFSNNSTTVGVHSSMQSPFATNYRFYKTLAAAQLDAANNDGAAAVTDETLKVAAGATVADKDTLYIRYDYNPDHGITDNTTAKNTVVIDGSKAYNMTIKDPKHSNTVNYIVYHGLNREISMVAYTPENPRRPNFLWKFVGTKAPGYDNPDPYDIKIVNEKGEDMSSSYVMTGMVNKKTFTNSEVQTNASKNFTAEYRADDPTTTTIQRFFLTRHNSNSTIQIAGANTSFIYQANGGSGSHFGQWFYISYYGDDFCYDPGERLGCRRKGNAMYGSQSTQIYLYEQTAEDGNKYVIVGDDKVYRVTAYPNVADGDNLSELKVPKSIKNALVDYSEYTYYPTQNDAFNKTNALSSLPGNNEVIYVRYTYNNHKNDVDLTGSREYNLKLNDIPMKYQKNYSSNCDIGVGTGSSNGQFVDTDAEVWTFSGNDPYGIVISNNATSYHMTGAGSMDSHIDMIANTNSSVGALVMRNADTYQPNKFFLTAGNSSGKYVMKAVFDNRGDYRYVVGWRQSTGTDASNSYCRMWRSDKLRVAGDSVYYQLELIEENTTPVTYHIIDKQNKEVISAQTYGKAKSVPVSVRSPLVSTYHYWTADNFTTTTRNDSIIYTLKENQTEISAVGDLTNIYVTYDVGTTVDLNSTVDTTRVSDDGVVTSTTKDGVTKKKFTETMAREYKNFGKVYRLKFLDGESFKMEDGADGVSANNKKAAYPYACGDGGLYVYSEQDWEDQLSKGASTRTRWLWYLMSETNDPYHVVVTSYQAVHSKADTLYNQTDSMSVKQWSYYGFLKTSYKSQSAAGYVTSIISDDPRVLARDANDKWSEYMVLGSAGSYRLVTVDKIGNGGEDTPDHRTVDALEQYWKTWETIRQAGTRDKEYKTGINPDLQGLVHNYDAWAYSRPDQENKKDKRYKYENHYFQTIEMGETFDLVEVLLDPVLVLVDNHGWEILRHPLPTSKDTQEQKDYKLMFLNSYNSPMVDKYLWYTKGIKASGYHNYTLSEPEIKEYKPDGTKWKETGKTYIHTSESLSDLPYDHLTNTDGSAYADANKTDLYVTYTVKDEFSNAYDSLLNVSAPYLFRQGDSYATTDGSTISTVAASTVEVNGTYLTPSGGSINTNMLWRLKRNADIDYEMGYLYKGETGAETDAKTKEELENEYRTRLDSLQHNGFDPYNVQIQVYVGENGKYFTTSAVDAVIHTDGTVQAATNYTTVNLQDKVTTQSFEANGHDNKTFHVTNQTFMIIKDISGRTRLFPRFDHLRAVENFTGMGLWNSENAGAASDFIPVGHYEINVCDSMKTASDPNHVLMTRDLWAKAGHPIGESPTSYIPLPADMVRGGCDYVGAFTTYDSSTNKYTGKTDFYPLYTDLTGANPTKIYVPFRTNGENGSAIFVDDISQLDNSSWNFLMQGLESVAVIYGKQTQDYGKAMEYGWRIGNREDIGTDIEGLSPAERSFVDNSSAKKAGFHFLQRMDGVDVNGRTGEMTVSSHLDNVGSIYGNRYMPTQKKTAPAYLMSPLNDFRRIAETYKDGTDTGFREGKWLWAFVGTPYKFEIINREAGTSKRLAVVYNTKTGDGRLMLTDDYADKKHYFTMTKFAIQKDDDPEGYHSFALQIWDDDNDASNDSVIHRQVNRANGNLSDFNILSMTQILYGKANPSQADKPQDIAYCKSSSFIAYPWNWDDKKYQAVTVNIYPGTQQHPGPLALTKTYTRADRAFIAGDVIDGTDGHFYLPIEGQEDGSWKPLGVYKNTVPYDGHKINIPYELRRRYCKYTVKGGSFTVQQDNSDNPTPQVLNVYYTVDTENAPLFISESELADFRNYKTNGSDAIYKDGKKYSDYFYFLDQNWQLSKHLYTKSDNNGYSEATRFSATNDPKQLMWYFVGDPYNVRLFNVYNDLKSSETRNFVRHRYADDTHSTGYNNGTDRNLDNKTYMEDVTKKVFYWEMVDTWVGDPKTKGELDSTHVNVSFRKDLLLGKPFALRMKVSGSEHPEAVISDATYFYLNHDGNTSGSNIYYMSENSLNPRMNKLDAFANFPDSRHLANSQNTTLTPLKPTKVKVTVYDPDEPTRKVTEDEVSDYFAVTDHFKGVPDNLQRKHCEYWWVSTNPDIKSTNMVDEDLYFTVETENPSIYVRYREDATSPFSTLVDGVPVLKRDANASPWYNMNIGKWWAFFNSSLDGTTYYVPKTYDNPQTIAGAWHDSKLSFVYRGDNLPTNGDQFRKGLQWALIGDPYNFTLRNNRNITQGVTISGKTRAKKDGNGNYVQDNAYINETAMGTTGTVWTWIRNGVKNTSGQYEYFLSESSGRRTEVTYTPASAKSFGGPRRILPSDYSIDAQTETKNITVNYATGTPSLTTGDNYAIGDNMWLLSVNDTKANNESFDAIVNVYNKLNELVATTGWTELARANAEWNGSLPVDVRRWGCTYHYWADETMTRYPFHTYDQKDANGNYLVRDSGMVYVTYDYDESLYSSENEYRWVNLFFNWDDEHKEWRNDSIKNEKLYSTEYWEYNKSTNEFEFRHQRDSLHSYRRWVQHDLYTDTQEGWIESPAENETTYSPTKAYAYHDGGQYTAAMEAKKQKWAMIGDPYKFILYNYNRKANAGPKNSYYLYRHKITNAVANSKINFNTSNPKETYEGLYWTWKVDGTRFTFAEGDAVNNTTAYGPREGLPESFYQDYAAASAQAASDSVRKAGYSIETGYLANCNMAAQSLYDKPTLVGSVSGYATYKHKYFVTDTLKTGTGANAPLTYHTGTKEKFYIYNDDPNDNADRTINYTTDTTTVIPAVYEGEVLKSDAVMFKDKWREVFGKSYSYDSETGRFTEGPYTGYYVGPTESLAKDKYQEITTYKSVQRYNLNDEDIVKTDQDLQVVLGTLRDGYVTVSKNSYHIPRFLVMPMKEQAKSITFHLQMDKYSDDSDTQSLRSSDNVVFDHTSENYGVGNTLMLPWMMRRAYCDYKFYLVGNPADGTDENNNLAAQITAKHIDDLTYTDDSLSNTHRLTAAERSAANTSFWTAGTLTDLSTKVSGEDSCYSVSQKEYIVPQSWAGKDVFILVKYKPTAEFESMRSTGANAVKWLNIKNVENGNMMRYTRSGNVTGESRDSLNDVTNDYLWAIEGDPYGFKLHSRYADHGFDGSQNENWSTVMTTDKVNSTEHFNYMDGLDDEGIPKNVNFTYNTSGDPVMKSGITYGKAGTGSVVADAFGTVGETTTNAVYEAMTGNYDKGMIIHPVNACINVRNQNGYKYYGAFMFNGAPTGDPVQLNYMQDWEVMRNVYANWQFKKPAAKQFLPYYERAGYVGGLLPDKAEANKTIFDKISAGTSLTSEEYNKVWALVQNPDSLVPFTNNGFYRLKAYSNNGAVGGEYVSGYLHKLEKTADGGTPLHIYERAGTATTLDKLENYDGNAWASGKESKIEVMNPEYDPSSIFRFTRDANGYVKMETQDMVVSNGIMIDHKAESANENDSLFQMQDIGLASFQMRTASNTTGENAETSYLSYNPTTMKYGLNTSAEELSISKPVSGGATVKTHDTKWLLEPVGAATENASGATYQRPLRLKLTAFNDDVWSTTFSVPYDIKLPEGVEAYYCGGSPQGVPGGNAYHGTLELTQIAAGETIPAGTPVIVKTTTQYVDAANGNSIVVTVPYQASSAKVGNEFFVPKYLTGEVDHTFVNNERVFVYGKVKGNPTFAVNATRDYDGQKNNRFTSHNKLYIILNNDAVKDAQAKGFTLVFGGTTIEGDLTGIDEVENDNSDNRRTVDDDTIYDIQGRKVERITQPGIYIRNGKKFVVRRGQY